MDIEDLASIDDEDVIDCDLAIIGGGPIGLTLARELANSSMRILVIESGQKTEAPNFNALLNVEVAENPMSEQAVAWRSDFHGPSVPLWSTEDQPYGVRCRVFGGGSQAWAGKSTLLDDIDFETRPWIPESGWPISRSDLMPFFDRAAEHLNLGPNCYDASLFQRIGVRPAADLKTGPLRSIFWQFARSRVNRLDVIRFGTEFAAQKFASIRVIVNATVTHLNTSSTGNTFESVEVSSLDGKRRIITTKYCVLAAGGIENARLLLASNREDPAGIGNRFDNVGRYLMDHPCARIAQYSAQDAAKVVKIFGFYGLPLKHGAQMYQHGLALSEAHQKQGGYLNCAAQFLELRSVDDPWEALKRLARGSRTIPGDLMAIARSPELILSGLGRKILSSQYFPSLLREMILNSILLANPRFAAADFLNRGVPHKLSGLAIDVICEQPPRRESRIVLSSKTDRLGVPLARVSWKIGDSETHTFREIAQQIRSAFPDLGLPLPAFAGWVFDSPSRNPSIIDMGHSCGTTRMSLSPESGVVDTNCQVHEIRGLFVAGSSVFPTSGHANTTLTAVGMAVRLADHLKHLARQL